MEGYFYLLMAAFIGALVGYVFGLNEAVAILDSMDSYISGSL